MAYIDDDWLLYEYERTVIVKNDEAKYQELFSEEKLKRGFFFAKKNNCWILSSNS